MNATRQKLVRDVIAAKQYMEATEKVAQEARHAYRLAESLYLKENPIPSTPPSDVYCDPWVIKALPNWREDGRDPRLEFDKAERCPTSE